MKVPAILLGCETRNIEGIIYSFGKRKIPLIGLCHKRNPLAFKSRYFQHKLISPHISQEQEYLDFLLNMKERGVIIGSDDATAEFLAKYQHVLRKENFLVNAPDLLTFKRGFEKNLVFFECQKAGIPTIKTLHINSFEDLKSAWEKLGGPLLIKPTKLAGGRYVIVRRKEDLEPSYEQMKEIIKKEKFRFQKSGIIAQEFIEFNYDDHYCCESYYSLNSVPTEFLTIRKVRPNINRDGSPGSRLFAGITEKNERIENNTRKLLNYLEWKGFAHVEWIYSSKYNEYLLCEINPRLPGFSNFLTKVGFEFAWYYYADLVGLSYKKPQFRKSVYFEALRIPGDLSNSIYSIFKGYIKLSDFIRSYLLIFNSDYQVCLDVFFKRDLRFTFSYWFKFLQYLLNRPFRRMKKKAENIINYSN